MIQYPIEPSVPVVPEIVQVEQQEITDRINIRPEDGGTVPGEKWSSASLLGSHEQAHYPVQVEQQEITDHINIRPEDGGTVPGAKWNSASLVGSHGQAHYSVPPPVDERQPLLAQHDANENPRVQLEGNPLYKCLQTEQNEGDRGFCGSVTRCMSCLYSFRIPLPCLAEWNSWREDVLSPPLQRALTTGEKMLTAMLFPLVTNHRLRCFWAAAQLIFSIAIFVLASLQQNRYYSQSNNNPQTTLASIFFALALIDTLCCLWGWLMMMERDMYVLERTYPSLLGLWHSFKLWLYKYNDVLRMVVAEALLYFLLVIQIKEVFLQDKIRNAINSDECDNINMSIITYPYTSCDHSCSLLIAFLATGVFVFVYVVQFVIIVRTSTIRHHLKEQSPSKRKLVSLITWFSLHFIGQRTVQAAVVSLATYSVYVNPCWYDISDQQLWLQTMSTLYFATSVGIATFLVLWYGWVQELYLTTCTDFLSNLASIADDYQTPQATKEAIEVILRKYEFPALCRDVRPFTDDRTMSNFIKSLQSPMVILLSLPNFILVGTFAGFTFILTLDFFIIAFVLITYIGIVNVHIVLILVSCLFLLTFVFPIHMFVSCFRMYYDLMH